MGNNFINDTMIICQDTYRHLLATLNNSDQNPRSLTSDHKLRLVPSKDWTSGFFPGILWYLYEYSEDESFMEGALHYTSNIEDQKYNGKTHDMGFKMYCSFGNGYRLTGNEKYREVLLQSAKTLVSRFNPTVGCIRSWDHNADKWDFPVIIDNMMNLELLMWAFKETNDSTFYKIAISHADKTIKNHFRDDNSSYHVIGYNPETGEVEHKQTHQGYSDDSAWARGQAWGLYGYTMMYRETGNNRYLRQADKIADFILSHENLPEDYIPYWDFNAPGIPAEFRDASAAAIICSALLELYSYASDKRESYLLAADKILQSLSSYEYLSQPGSENIFILKHCVGNIQENDAIDLPIVYADYYFVEALVRRNKIVN